jgi:hypothetical protein
VEQLARHAENTDLARARKLLDIRYRRLLEDLDELGQETGLEGPELLRRATMDAPALEGPVSHSAFLWARPAPGQFPFAWMPRHIPIPDFGWYGMNDRGVSLTFVAILLGGALYEDTFFRGRSLWFWGVSTGTSLALFGFDGIASSGHSS